MIQAQITIPLQDNTGLPFPEHMIEAWSEEACTIFGGATFQRGGHGHWIGERKRYSEPVGVLCIDFDGSLGKRGEVLELARDIKRAFFQESVYVRFVPVDSVVLV